MTGGRQAGEVVLWDVPSGASSLLSSSRAGLWALKGSLWDRLHGSSSCSVTAHLQTYCAFQMSLVDLPGVLLFRRDQDQLCIS